MTSVQNKLETNECFFRHALYPGDMAVHNKNVTGIGNGLYFCVEFLGKPVMAGFYPDNVLFVGL